MANGNGKAATVDARLDEIKKTFPKAEHTLDGKRASLYVQRYKMPEGYVAHVMVVAVNEEALAVIARLYGVAGSFDAVKYVDTPKQAIIAIGTMVEWVKACKKANIQFFVYGK